MYRIGDVVTLLVDKTEGAGPASLNVRAGITGMIVNAGRACRPGDYSYIVDFGPEGQWNCVHNELNSLSMRIDDEPDYEEEEDEEDGWDEDNDDEPQQDITEEEATRIYADESARPGYGVFTMEPSTRSSVPDPEENIKPHKKIDFEADLARIAKEIEKGMK